MRSEARQDEGVKARVCLNLGWSSGQTRGNYELWRLPLRAASWSTAHRAPPAELGLAVAPGTKTSKQELSAVKV